MSLKSALADQGARALGYRFDFSEEPPRDGAVLILALEGTRSKRDRWKSGFYRIARDANLPIATGFTDSTSRTIGLGPTIYPSQDVVADMDRLREFYQGTKGWKPGLESRIWISMEEGADG